MLDPGLLQPRHQFAGALRRGVGAAAVRGAQDDPMFPVGYGAVPGQKHHRRVRSRPRSLRILQRFPDLPFARIRRQLREVEGEAALAQPVRAQPVPQHRDLVDHPRQLRERGVVVGSGRDGDEVPPKSWRPQLNLGHVTNSGRAATTAAPTSAFAR